MSSETPSSAMTPGKVLRTFSTANRMPSRSFRMDGAKPIETDRRQDQGAEEKLNPVGIDFGEHHAVLDQHNEHDSQRRGGDRDVAARQGRAPDDRRGEGNDQPVGADRRLRRPKLSDREDGGDRREKARERVGEDDRSIPRNSGELGRLRIAADRQKVAPRNRAGKKEAERRGDDKGRRQQIGHGEEAFCAEGDECGREIVERNRSGDAQVDPGEDRRGRKRNDETVDAGANGEQPVGEPAASADQQSKDDSKPDRKSEFLHDAAHRNGYKAAERADRKIELANAEGQHLGEGDHQDDAKRSQHHIEIELGQKCRRHKGQNDKARENGGAERRPFLRHEMTRDGHGLRSTPRRSAYKPRYRSSITATSRTSPRKSWSQKFPTWRMRRPDRIVVTSNAPSTVPTTDTMPPASSVPPRTGARNDGSSQSWPTDGMAAPSHVITMSPAEAASNPESAWTMTVTRPTGTPESSAARGLAPEARISRPRAVQRNRTRSQAPIASAMRSRGDTKPQRMRPKLAISRGIPL